MGQATRETFPGTKNAHRAKETAMEENSTMAGRGFGRMG